jgi:hypothetical protein
MLASILIPAPALVVRLLLFVFDEAMEGDDVDGEFVVVKRLGVVLDGVLEDNVGVVEDADGDDDGNIWFTMMK